MIVNEGIDGAATFFLMVIIDGLLARLKGEG